MKPFWPLLNPDHIHCIHFMVRSWQNTNYTHFIKTKDDIVSTCSMISFTTSASAQRGEYERTLTKQVSFSVIALMHKEYSNLCLISTTWMSCLVGLTRQNYKENSKCDIIKGNESGCCRYCFWDIGKERFQVPLFYIGISIDKLFITL